MYAIVTEEHTRLLNFLGKKCETWQRITIIFVFNCCALVMCITYNNAITGVGVGTCEYVRQQQ